MRLTNLKPGTKLMWDVQGEEEHFLYPAIVSPSKAPNAYLKKCVRITTAGNTSWMGPEEESLRLPTEEELELYTWPEPKIYMTV